MFRQRGRAKLAFWNEGYVTDVGYTINFFREMTPAWLAFTAVSLGHRPPDLSRPFRWAELGCGNGFTAAVVAAAYPQAEVWAMDFNPAHIEVARDLSQRAGLANLTFIEASFADLAETPAARMPAFDFITAHGVYSWIAPEHRRQITDFVRDRLRPGGLFYNSYNDVVGWAAMLPVRALMRTVAEATPGTSDEALGPITALIGTLREGGAGFFKVNPAVESKLETLQRVDPRYVVHEYLNAHWHPLMFTDVAGEAAEAKCSFVGSATLTDNIETTSVPPDLLAAFRGIRDVRLKETVRDFASAQSFRRDIYRKGTNRLSTGEHLALLDEIRLIAVSDPPQDDAELTFSCSIGTLAGSREVYGPLLHALAEGPLSLTRARQTAGLADKSLNEVLQALTLLTSAGYTHPAAPGNASAARTACRELNRAITATNAAGSNIRSLAAPAIGSAITVDPMDALVIGAVLDGHPPAREVLAEQLERALERTGRHILREGKAVEEPAEVRRLAREIVDATLTRGAPRLRQLGILDGDEGDREEEGAR